MVYYYNTIIANKSIVVLQGITVDKLYCGFIYICYSSYGPTTCI